jgi:hypothetical protein
MKFKKKLLVALMLLGAASMDVHAGLVKYLVLNTTDGQQVIALADKPVMTISGGELKVTVGGVEKVSAKLDNVMNYQFQEQDATAISNILTKGDRLAEGHVYMTSVKAGETIVVFGADGRQILSQVVGSDGQIDIDLTTLPKGVYIVKSPATSLKVINK